MSGPPVETRTISELLDTMDAGPALEPAGAARAWLDARPGVFGASRDGAAPDAEAMAVSNPATGERLAAVARCSEAGVAAIVAAAGNAGAGWAATPGHARARHLRAVARALEARGRLLAVLDALNGGRPVRAARDRDLPRAAGRFAHHAGSAELCEADFPGRAPRGVRALILSRHATLDALARGVAPALAAGNAVVIKPAAATPLVALAFAELCRDAGLPPGVVSVAPGDAATGAALARHPAVAGISFAGPRDHARAIRAAAAGSGRALDVGAEKGAQRMLVFADADLDAAVEGVVEAAWSDDGASGDGSGRAGAWILVQEGVAERFAAGLRRRMRRLRVGDPLDGSTDVGPMADDAGPRRLRDIVAAAEREGAEAVRADAPLPPALASRPFFPPTLLLGVEPAMSLARTDFSGPLATLTTFRTPAEAVALAGDAGPDASGSDASVWSQDVDLALGVATRLRAGAIWINSAGLGPGDPATEADAASLEGQLALASAPAPRPSDALGGRAAADPVPVAAAIAGTVAAVAAAARAAAWGAAPPSERARALAGAAEALATRSRDLIDRLSAVMGAAEAEREVEAALRRMAFYAARAGRLGRLDGRAGTAGERRLALAIDEPHGVVGIACPDEAPLLALASLVLPVLAAGNRAVAVPSTLCPAVADDLARTLVAGGVPPGALSIAAGARGAAARVPASTLAGHDGIEAMWHHGPAAEAAAVEGAAGLKPVWIDDGPSRDWHDETAQEAAFLRRAVRTRTLWLPYGE